ncbi:hypothetical protein [Nocardia arthritidis]|nr:hypothetical protein [Nocardia arthritidis]
MESETKMVSTEVAALQTLPERDHGVGTVIWPDPTWGSACHAKD